ncbi:MAG TPA: type II toxin-antitoxin system VapC family toxin [Candidatus Omnitrophota bacterium]|nr:type II toxin-antitoxin system VapC family toxin [Candidatus Omnitrophota bacterium]
MVKVLDASALMAYLEREPGYEKIRELFVKTADNGRKLLMSTVNWGEVFYILIRDYGIEEAERVQKIIETFPIEFVPPDLVITKQAAFYKATKKLPYADCFAAALAKLQKGEVVTGDKEFKAIENDVRVVWIT